MEERPRLKWPEAPALPPEGYRKYSVTAGVLSGLCILTFPLLYSHGTADTFELMFGKVFAFIWALIWFIRWGSYTWRVQHGKQQDNRPWYHWCIEPLILAIMSIAAGTDSFTKIRLRLGAAEMERYARELYAKQTLPAEPDQTGNWILAEIPEDRTIGQYRVIKTEVARNGAVRFETKRQFLGGPGGFVYVPHGQTPQMDKKPPPAKGFFNALKKKFLAPEPLSSQRETYRHIIGPWWEWQAPGEPFLFVDFWPPKAGEKSK